MKLTVDYLLIDLYKFEPNYISYHTCNFVNFLENSFNSEANIYLHKELQYIYKWYEKEKT